MATTVEEAEIHQLDIGTIFEVTLLDTNKAVFDISSATTLELRFKKPDPNAAIVVKTASLSTDGTDGKMRYVTIADDLDMAGDWKLQGYVSTAIWTGFSSIGQFEVQPNL